MFDSRSFFFYFHLSNHCIIVAYIYIHIYIYIYIYIYQWKEFLQNKANEHSWEIFNFRRDNLINVRFQRFFFSSFEQSLYHCDIYIHIYIYIFTQQYFSDSCVCAVYVSLCGMYVCTYVCACMFICMHTCMNLLK